MQKTVQIIKGKVLFCSSVLVNMLKKKYGTLWNLMEPYGTLWNIKAPDRNFESITDQTSVDCHRVPLGLRVKSAIRIRRMP
jgi:hypothetical protein